MEPGLPPGKSRPYPAGNGKVWLAAGSLAPDHPTEQRLPSKTYMNMQSNHELANIARSKLTPMMQQRVSPMTELLKIKKLR